MFPDSTNAKSLSKLSLDKASEGFLKHTNKQNVGVERPTKGALVLILSVHYFLTLLVDYTNIYREDTH